MTSSNIKNYLDGKSLEENLNASLLQVVENGKPYLKGLLLAGRANDGTLVNGIWTPNPDSYLKSRFEVNLETMNMNADVIPVNLSYDNITDSEEYAIALDASTNVNFMIELSGSSSFVLHVLQKVYEFNPEKLNPIYKDTFSYSIPVVPITIPSKRQVTGKLLNNYSNARVLLTVDNNENSSTPLTELILTIQNVDSGVCGEVVFSGTDLTQSKGSPYEYIKQIYNKKNDREYTHSHSHNIDVHHSDSESDDEDDREDDINHTHSHTHKERKIVKTQFRLPITSAEDLKANPPVLKENAVYKFGMYAENAQGRSALSNRVKVSTVLKPSQPTFHSLSTMSEEGGYLLLRCKADHDSRVKLNFFNGTADINVPTHSFTVPFSVRELRKNVRNKTKIFERLSNKVINDPTLQTNLTTAEDEKDAADDEFEKVILNGDGTTSFKLNSSTLAAMYDEYSPTNTLSNADKAKELLSLIYGKLWGISLTSKFMYDASNSTESDPCSKVPFVDDNSIDTISYKDVQLDVGSSEYVLKWGATSSASTFSSFDSFASYNVSANLFVGTDRITNYGPLFWDSKDKKVDREFKFLVSSLSKENWSNAKLHVKFEQLFNDNGFGADYPKKTKNFYKNLMTLKDNVISERRITDELGILAKRITVQPQQVTVTGLKVTSTSVLVKLDQSDKHNTASFDLALYEYNTQSGAYTLASYQDGLETKYFSLNVGIDFDLSNQVQFDVLVEKLRVEPTLEYAIGIISKSANPNVPDSSVRYSDRFKQNDFTTTAIVPTLYLNKQVKTKEVLDDSGKIKIIEYYDVTASVFISTNVTKTKQIKTLTLYTIDDEGNIRLPDESGDISRIKLEVVTDQVNYLDGKRYYKRKAEVELTLEKEYRVVAELILNDGLGDLMFEVPQDLSVPAIFNTFPTPEFLNVVFSKSLNNEEAVTDTIDFDVNLNNQSKADLLPFMTNGNNNNEIFVMILPTIGGLLGSNTKTDIIAGVNLSADKDNKTGYYHGKATFTGEIVSGTYLLLLGLSTRQFVISRGGVYGSDYIGAP